MRDKAIYQALLDVGRRRYPGLVVKYKDESVLMRLVGKLLFFTPFSQATTVFGRNVWFPSRKFVETESLNSGYKYAWKILAHELVHIGDGERFRFGFFLLYTFPQNLSLVAALGLLSHVYQDPWWTRFYWFLICALPWPSLTRAWLEMRGYSMNLAIGYWRYGSIAPETRNWILGVFSSSLYYWMLPQRWLAKLWLTRYERVLRRGGLLSGRAGEPFRMVLDVLTSVRES